MGGAGIRVLMLASDAHGGFGGISQYNCDVLDVMSGLERVREIVVLPRVVTEPDFKAPRKIRYDLAGLAGPLSYLRRGMTYAFANGSFDLVYCAHVNLLPAAALIARIQRAPLILAIYGIDVWSPRRTSAMTKLIARTNLVISISHITLERYGSWNAIDARNAAIVPNAIRRERYGAGPKDYELERRLGLEGRKILMTLGRMRSDERSKGFDEVIELLPELKEAEPAIAYLIVGDGDDRRRLEDKAKRLGVNERVVFAGRVPEETKSDYYRLADTYVMPSSEEGFGFVILEALACGIPVVASNIDGTREAVRNGELGKAVNPKDKTALKTAIIESLTRPKEVPPGLAYFSFERFAERLHEAFRCVIDV